MTRAAILAALVLACAACQARRERAAEPAEWDAIAREPLVRFEVDELCFALGDAAPRCTDAVTASAHLTAAGGAIELHVSDRVEMKYLGRWDQEQESEQLFQLYAQWPMSAPSAASATDAVLVVPVLGTCEALVGNGFGPCEITTDAMACTLPSVAAETPIVEVRLAGDALSVVFEAMAGEPPPRCCEAAVGCEATEPGTFAPAAALVRGELRATRSYD